LKTGRNFRKDSTTANIKWSRRKAPKRSPGTIAVPGLFVLLPVDRSVTDNGDSEKVLATVVAAVYAFCDQFPQSWIYATGSTEARTRLYRMGINKYFDIVQEDFEIFGLTQNEWERFIKGEDYRAFAIQRKNLNLDYEKYT